MGSNRNFPDPDGFLPLPFPFFRFWPFPLLREIVFCNVLRLPMAPSLWTSDDARGRFETSSGEFQIP